MDHNRDGDSGTMRMSMLFLAVVAILGSCIAVAVGVSEESNAALGTFT